jgi:TonB-linked SusC/RagA family outer membrane protein
MRKLLPLLIFLMLSGSIGLFAQNKVFSGAILDENGNRVPFASVKIKGTNKGVSTDESGNFTIQLSANQNDLEISAVGFSTTTVKASDKMSVTLASSSKTLSPVTVSALGFKKSKDKSAYSNSSVKGDAVVKSGEANLINGLASKASGVNVSRTGGDPGAGASIQIRGQSTISGDLQPLIVIDGIPVSNSNFGSSTEGVTQQSRLNDINPSDIESYEVLKGAAAASLYGTRAANGVIMITTKKGKNSSGKVRISYESTVSFDQLNKSVPLQTNYAQGTNGVFSLSQSRSWGDKISDRLGGADVPLTPSTGYLLLPDGSQRYLVANGTTSNPHGGRRSKEVYDHSTDLFRTGYFWDNNISFSGGDDNGHFYLSLGNLDQKGILKNGSDYTRRTIRFNSDRKFGAIQLNTGLAYSYSNSNRVQQGSNLNGIFLGGLRTSPDFDNSVYEGTYVDFNGIKYPGRQVSYRNQIGSKTSSGYDNPFWVINNITNQSRVNRFIPSMEASLKMNDWLQVINRAGLDYYLDRRIENYPVLASGDKNGGYLSEETISEIQVNNDLMLKADYNKLKDVTLSAVLGYNYNIRSAENIGATVRNFILPGAPFDLGNSAQDQRTAFNSQSKIVVNGAYLQGNIGYKDFLYLDLTGRYERYSTVNKGFFYPSASLAYVFKTANSGTESDILSFGKMRMSYGQVGVPAGPYAWSDYFAPALESESWGAVLDASSTTYGGGYSRSSVQGNPDIRPEIKTEMELGSDLRFFNNRLSVSATYYSNKTKDVILSVQVPSSTGYDNKLDNIGTIQNKGIELDVNGLVYNANGFKINSGFIFSKNTNKVVDMGGSKSVFLNGFTGCSSRAVEGYALGSLWGVDFLKDETGKLVLDANGFAQANSEEGVIGNPNPDWTGAFNTSVSYKNFTLGFVIDHVQGGDVWNGTKGALYTFGTHADVGNEVVSNVDLYTYTGATIAAGTPFRGAIYDFGGGPVALTQSWYTSTGGGFGPVASQFIEDGTRTRLREASLGYSFKNENLKKKAKISSIDISLTGRNLALSTKYSGIDPETNLTGPSNGRGLDYFNNPSTRSYLFTIKINY